jgi:hypothetical protein
MPRESVLDWRSSLLITDSNPWMLEGSTWAPVPTVVDACARPHLLRISLRRLCGRIALTTSSPLL